MRAVVCRVDGASVKVDGRCVGSIEKGLLVYLGVMRGDCESDAQWMAEKLVSLRVFGDAQGKMNLCVADVTGGILLIPNFTLAGRTSKGTRPSFSDAERPELAKALFECVARSCSSRVSTATGVFGADMRIDAVFNGPVTVVVDTPDKRVASLKSR